MKCDGFIIRKENKTVIYTSSDTQANQCRLTSREF